MDRHADLEEGMERIFVALDGPLVEALDGSVSRDRKRGLVHQAEINGRRLESIEQAISNGIRTRMSRTVTGSIVTACGMVVAASADSVIDLLKSL